jgi:hypothetical protein
MIKFLLNFTELSARNPEGRDGWCIPAFDMRDRGKAGEFMINAE